MTPKDAEILRDFCAEHPEGKTALLPRHLNVQEITKFAEWYVTSGKGSSEDAGALLARLWQETSRRPS